MNEDIFQAAVAVSRRVGFLNLSRSLLAAELGRSETWVGNQRVTISELVEAIGARASELGVGPGQRPPSGHTRAQLWAPVVREEILQAATHLLRRQGWFTRAEVADRVGVAPGTVSNQFGGMENLRRAAMAELFGT